MAADERSGERNRRRRERVKQAQKQRRAVSQSTGKIETKGSAVEAGKLAAAWRAGRGEARELTHGLHAYPARVHPHVVRSLIASFSGVGDLVVDPFVGSGTVLVEALAAGRRAFGGDVNPIAARIARVKTLRLPGDERRTMEATAAKLGTFVLKLSREGELVEDDEEDDEKEPFSYAKYYAERNARRDAEGEAALDSVEHWFPRDVLAELRTLRDAIAREPETTRRFVLEMVLSSIAIRMSQKSAETVEFQRVGRVPRGAPARFYRDRAEEFGKGIAELCRVTPQGSKEPVVAMADARNLPLSSGCAKLVVSSPPYLGTYDYAGIQALRATMFAIDLTAAKAHELGSRSTSRERHPGAAIDEFRSDFSAALREMRRIAKPGGNVVLIVGDSAVRDRFIDGLELTTACAAAAGLDFVAAASEERPSTYRLARGRRHEHLVLLRAPGSISDERSGPA